MVVVVEKERYLGRAETGEGVVVDTLREELDGAINSLGWRLDIGVILIVNKPWRMIET